MARWAQKLRLENRFELRDGKLTVNSPGIYYLYAQVRDISLQPELQTGKYQIFALKSQYLSAIGLGCISEIHEIFHFPFQINYLDESDVNGFQIYVNDSPIFLCTAMTHTPTATTKANTCYTGGLSLKRDEVITSFFRGCHFSGAWGSSVCEKFG